MTSCEKCDILLLDPPPVSTWPIKGRLSLVSKSWKVDFS